MIAALGILLLAVLALVLVATVVGLVALRNGVPGLPGLVASHIAAVADEHVLHHETVRRLEALRNVRRR